MNREFNNQPLVSIIMNCYNGELFLKQAIDSVITQTYPNWEIIFWDNQSTDKSATIFKSYSDSRLKYYCASKHTKILYKAKNDALKKINGEFIAFLDVDDWWLPSKLNEQISLFKNQSIGLVYGNFWYFFEKAKKKKIFKKTKLPTGKILGKMLEENLIGSPTYVIRKKSLHSLDYYFDDNFHIIGDYDLQTRLSIKWNFECVQKPIAYARRHGKNESLLNRDLEIKEMKIWYDQFKNNPKFLSHKAFYNIPKNILYLETMDSILKEKFSKSFLKVMKYPMSIKKIKLIIALFLPKVYLIKIKNY